LQVIWVYHPESFAGVDELLGFPEPSCVLANADLLLPLNDFERLRSGGTSLQHIKDIIATAALGLGSSWPALYADLKVLWIPGRTLVHECPVVVGMEPCKSIGARQTNRQVRIDEATVGQPWLGFLGLALSSCCSFYERLNAELLHFWRRYTDRVLGRRRSVLDWSVKQNLWMRNVSSLFDHTESRPTPAAGSGSSCPPAQATG